MKSNQYIFGMRSVLEAVRAGREIDRILFRKDLKGDLFQELFQLARKRSIPYQFVPVEKLNRVTRKTHQGIIAYVSPITYQSIESIVPSVFESGEAPFIIVLDGITDVRNLGAIARTASCASVHALIIPVSGSAQINADAIKTSAGALNTLPVCRARDLAETVKYLKNSGIHVFGACEKAELTYHEASLGGPVALVMGAEDKGISERVLKVCHELVRIPVYGHIGSLNVSAAASVLIYETVRQRQAAE